MTYTLFDIDGTLTVGGEGGSAGTVALNRAFCDLFGIENAFDDIQKAGKTDPIITREGFGLNGVQLTEHDARRFQERYLHHLGDLIRMPERQPRVLPGVVELLSLLQARDDVAIGLLTGNWQAGALLSWAASGWTLTSIVSMVPTPTFLARSVKTVRHEQTSCPSPSVDSGN